jgi:hypothetical protein
MASVCFQTRRGKRARLHFTPCVATDSFRRMTKGDATSLTMSRIEAQALMSVCQTLELWYTLHHVHSHFQAEGKEVCQPAWRL